MPFNRIAVYGHRGWASSAIVAALIASNAPIKVLYRPGSDISAIPQSVAKIGVDLADQDKVVAALQDIDIVISIVGHEGVTQQHHLFTAIPKTNVRLFVPSKLAARYDEQGMRIPVDRAKGEVGAAAAAAGIPMTLIFPENFAEFAQGTPAMGVDCPNNRIVFTGNNAHEALSICTRSYVAASYVSIFTSTPIEQLQSRALTVSELKLTGAEIVTALTEKFGSRTLTTTESTESINERSETALEAGSLFALPYYYRKILGTGQQAEMLGRGLWDVKGYKKASLRDLIVGCELKAYQELPQAVMGVFEPQFEQCS